MEDPRDTSKNADLESRKIESSILLAYFNVLRAEIISRSGFQNTIIPAALAASATIMTLYFNLNFAKERNDYAYLVLSPIPLFLPALGLIWLEHYLSISTIGRFLQIRLLPRLFSTSKPELPPTGIFVAPFDFSRVEWETFSQEVIAKQQRDRIDLIPYQAIFGYFPLAVWLYLVVTTFRRGLHWPLQWPSILSTALIACSGAAVCYFFFASWRVNRMVRETKKMLRD